MKRWLPSLGSLLLLGGCRMLAPTGKRPSFHGSIRKPAWTVGGIAAESLEASPEVVLVVGHHPGDSVTQLFALDTATGQRLWNSAAAVDRIAALGRRTAFVLTPASAPRDPAVSESVEALRSRLCWIDLTAGRELPFAHDWMPLRFSEERYYGFDPENYLVAVDEDGRIGGD